MEQIEMTSLNRLCQRKRERGHSSKTAKSHKVTEPDALTVYVLQQQTELVEAFVQIT